MMLADAQRLPYAGDLFEPVEALKQKLPKKWEE